MDSIAPLQCRIQIDAAPAVVWELVGDIRRMPDWSPQVDGTRLADGARRVELGCTFVNDNSHGPLTWTTHGRVVRLTPGLEIAFRIEENWVVWSFSLTESEGGGTVLTQTRETPEGISDYSLRLTDRYMGGQRVFTEMMRGGMEETLGKIKAEAERVP